MTCYCVSWNRYKSNSLHILIGLFINRAKIYTVAPTGSWNDDKLKVQFLRREEFPSKCLDTPCRVLFMVLLKLHIHGTVSTTMHAWYKDLFRIRNIPTFPNLLEVFQNFLEISDNKLFDMNNFALCANCFSEKVIYDIECKVHRDSYDLLCHRAI